MSKDNNKTKKSQVDLKNSNAPSEDFLEFYTQTSYWDEHKANTEKLSNLYNNNPSFKRYSERTKTCAEFLTYANRLDLKNGELVKKLTNGNFCRVRLCPVCQWRRSLMWQSRFYDAIPQVIEQFSKHRFLFLTLTIKNCAITDLASNLKLMNASFKKLLKLKKIQGKFDGWLKTTEVTRNKKTNEAHPHFHILLMVKPSYFNSKNYITHLELAELWQKVLKVDYLPNIDIRTVKNKHNNKDDLTTAVQELLKYSVKESDLLADAKWLYELTEQVFKKRFIASGGALKDILKESTEDNEDFLNDEELDAIESVENEEVSIVFKFSRDFSKYKKHKHQHTDSDYTDRDQFLRRVEHNKKENLELMKLRQIEREQQLINSKNLILRDVDDIYVEEYTCQDLY